MPTAQRLRLIYRAWRYRFRKDPGEIALLRNLLASGDTALDIGAHKGAYTYWMQQAVGPAGRVFAFEPQPQLAKELVEVFRHSAGVSVHPLGLSARPGRMTLHIPCGGPSPGASFEHGECVEGLERVEVAVESLDHFFAAHSGRPVRFIKCDVEGHELEVFRGAKAILRDDRPTLLFECEQRHHRADSFTAVFDHLASLGYSGSCFLRRKLIPLAEFRPEQHQIPGRAPYVNNFVFQPLVRIARQAA